MAILSSKKFSYPTSLFLAKCVFVGVAFMPTLVLHFAIAFLNKISSISIKLNLKIAYGFTLIFLVLLIVSRHFISGIYDYQWGYYPRGGVIHAMHVLFVMSTGSYAIYLLWRGLIEVERIFWKNKKYYEVRTIFIACLIIFLSGSDFLHNWGLDFFPLGWFFVALFTSIVTYAIFRHEFLGISVVIQKSLVYSIVISIITSIYFLLVFAISSLVGSVVEVHSFPLTLLIFAIISLLFRPMERRIQKLVDRFFFKRPIEEVEKENIVLLQKLQDQDRMKSVATLAAGMAHEIKNPLTSIKTFAEYLPKKYDDPEFREKFSRIVVDEVDRVNNIVKQLLEFSKPSPPNLKPILIGDLLDQTLGLLNSNMLRYQIELTKELDVFAMVSGDRNQLKQAFLNLFLNSIQSMTDGGKLRVSARSEQGGSTRISISDTGSGMTPEQIQHAFDPFFTTKEDGTGLGLAIVHSIITKHGGKIEIQSNLGKGTTVNVFLKSRD